MDSNDFAASVVSVTVSTRRGRPGRPHERGALLVWFALAFLLLIGFIGAGMDIGRMYLVRNEAQAFVDAGALAAAAELDGTTAGVARAVTAGVAAWKKYHFASNAFPSPTVEFSTVSNGGWITAGSVPNPATGYRFVRVTSNIALPMYLMPVVTGQANATIAARAIAGQVRINSSSEGLFPFSPVAHSADPNANDGYGLTKGVKYTMRWPSDAASDLKKGKTGNFCPGDADPDFLASLATLADSGELNSRGFIEINSTAVISDSITGGYQSFTKTIGDNLDFSGGMKAATATEMNARADSDTNQTDYASWAAYDDSVSGYYATPHNGRRIVVAPIARPPDSLTPNQILDFAAFLLDPEYDKSPQKSFCAMYLGSGVEWVAHPGSNVAGLYALRLVQ